MRLHRETRPDVLALTMPHGVMRTHRFVPQGPPRGGLVVYMDVFGLRPELFDMCAGYAAEGFVVYLPNVFYRAGDVSFPPPSGPTDPTPPQAVELNATTTLAMTAADLPAILEHAGDIGNFAAIGYCMGGRHAINALATQPARVKAAASIHGGRLVTPGDDSPHLLISKLQGPAYFAFATDDHACPDTDQAMIRVEIVRAVIPHIVEKFDAQHGWSFPQRYCHDPVAAAQVRARSLHLFSQATGENDA